MLPEAGEKKFSGILAARSLPADLRPVYDAGLRITSYNVCYTKLLRVVGSSTPIRLLAEPEKKSPAGDGPVGAKSNPEKMALADPLLAEVLREFEGATVLEVRAAPRRTQIPAVADAEGQEPDEGAEEAEEPE